ncbi:hypothetical protein CIB48_g9639 [Xylaria polymorpha]|nr:hypothetical protein CIB48_g9639 [Xylaria polymorpha]
MVGRRPDLLIELTHDDTMPETGALTRPGETLTRSEEQYHASIPKPSNIPRHQKKVPTGKLSVIICYGVVV